MGQGFKEVANLRTDIKKFDDNFSQIKWNDKKCDCHLHENQVCDICQGIKDGTHDIDKEREN